jgi:hypothetical protein
MYQMAIGYWEWPCYGSQRQSNATSGLRALTMMLGYEVPIFTIVLE